MVIYLCATRRGRAEGRSGGAEVLRQRRGGSELGKVAKRGERGPRHPSGHLGSTGGLAETPGIEARLLRRSVEAERSWRDPSAAGRCSAPSRGRAERLGFGRGAAGRVWGKRGRRVV